MPDSKSKYDLFFSKSMEQPSIAKAFFAQHIPSHIKPVVDLETCTRVDRTNTDDKLKQRHRDIVYKAEMEEKKTLFLCTEHQSQEDLTMPIRFLYYNADLIGPYFQAHKKLPLVINFLLYNGKKSPYPHASELHEYYEYPQWGRQELALRFHVIDCNQLSDRDILTHGYCAPMEVLLKYSRGATFELEISAYQEVFLECIEAVGDQYIITMLTYAAELSNKEIGEKLFKFIEEIRKRKSCSSCC